MQIRTGRLLPDLTFPAAASDAPPVSLRGGRGPRAVVVLHGPDCAACRDYARRVADAAPAAAEWGGRMIVVYPEDGVALGATDAAPARAAAPRGSPASGRAPGPPGPPGPHDPEAIAVVRDPDGLLASGAPFVAVADEWGEICFASEGEGRGAEGGSGHELPDPAELADWIRFAAIQCPECEGPEGEWRTL